MTLATHNFSPANMASQRLAVLEPQRELRPDGLYELPVTKATWVEAKLGDVELPESYAVVGGAARNILETTLGWDVPPPRDVDIVYLGDSKAEDRAVSNRLAQTYAPRDFAHGHGVQPVRDISEYMRTRDFTINQCLATPEVLITSSQAISDMRRHIIRPTVYEHDGQRTLSDKLAVKAVVLQADLITGGVEDASIRGVDLGSLYSRGGAAQSFWLLLGLNKALELGQDVTRKTVQLLGRYNMLDEDMRRVGANVSNLIALLDRDLDAPFDLSDSALGTLREMRTNSTPRPLTIRLGDVAMRNNHR